MSRFDSIDSVDVDLKPTRRGPKPTCDIYGEGTLDDWRRVENTRTMRGSSWTIAQRKVDALLGITEPIPNNFFQYHWKRKCSCWPAELRR